MRKEKPTGEITLQTLAMPADTNPSGDIFGGWVMSQMDIASAICAAEHAKKRVVTAAVDSMSFIEPVYVGDVLTVFCSPIKFGRTSITIYVETWVRRNRIGELVKVTTGEFIFVALDVNGDPTPLTS